MTSGEVGQTASVTLDGITYVVRATRDEEGVTRVALITDNPPVGLSEVLYEWNGRRQNVGQPQPERAT